PNGGDDLTDRDDWNNRHDWIGRYARNGRGNLTDADWRTVYGTADDLESDPIRPRQVRAVFQKEERLVSGTVEHDHRGRLGLDRPRIPSVHLGPESVSRRVCRGLLASLHDGPGPNQIGRAVCRERV